MSSGSDVIRLSKADYETKSFKTAPSGTYHVQVSAKSCIKQGSNGNLLNVQVTIAKGPHKGVNIFDNIAPHVIWKIAQLLTAVGVPKVGELTLQRVLRMVSGKDLRAVVSEGSYNDKPQNKITQYLPLEQSASDDAPDDADDDDDDDPRQKPLSKKSKRPPSDDDDQQDDDLPF